MTAVVVVVAIVVAVATYLTWLARRLDRLGVRVDAARGGLVAQLGARAEAAAALGASRGLVQLAAAAERSLAGHAAPRAGAPLDTAVEETENELSRALRAPEVATAGQGAPALLHAVDSASAKVALARQLHNDAVRDLRALRGRRPVRLLRLSGRRPLPAYFEIDDALPARVERRETGGPGPGASVPSSPAGAGAGPPLGQEVRDRVPGPAGAPDDMPDVLPKTGS